MSGALSSLSRVGKVLSRTPRTPRGALRLSAMTHGDLAALSNEGFLFHGSPGTWRFKGSPNIPFFLAENPFHAANYATFSGSVIPNSSLHVFEPTPRFLAGRAFPIERDEAWDMIMAAQDPDWPSVPQRKKVFDSPAWYLNGLEDFRLRPQDEQEFLSDNLFKEWHRDPQWMVTQPRALDWLKRRASGGRVRP